RQRNGQRPNIRAKPEKNPSLFDRRTSGEPHFGHAIFRLGSTSSWLSSRMRLYKKYNTRLVFFRKTFYKGNLDAFLKRGFRRGGYVAAVAVLGAYGWIALRGPQGIPALLEKHREIRQ